MNSLNKTCTVLLPLSLAVMTQTSLVQASDDVYQLDDVIVTATRTAQTADQTLAPVSVVTRQDIEESQATGVYELLDKLPGVQMTSNGGPGATTNLQIRGSSSSQVLVMIDGQRIGSATLGTAPIEYLDPNQIERIEVVRGPRASLYGADAVGGVMNIITRMGKGAPKATFSAGYGSRNTRTGSANLSGSTENTRYHFGISRFITDGYDRTFDKEGYNRDKDFYHNTTVTAKANHDVTSKLTLGTAIFHSEGVSAYDNGAAYSPRTNFTEQAFSSFAKYDVSDIWQTDLTLSHTVDDSEVTRASWLSSNKTSRNLINWKNDIAISNNSLLTTGLDYYKDKYSGTSELGKNSRDNKAFFAQTQTAFDSSDLLLAARYDKNQAYGGNTTGNIAWGFDLPSNVRLIASYGTAFKAPTFNDLYNPYGGNPDLKPEKSENKELELRGHHKLGTWSFSAFQNDIDDMIIWKPESEGSSMWKPFQVDSARIRGIEAQSTVHLLDWRLTGTITLLDPEDRETGKSLEYRAKQSASIDAYKRHNDFGFGGTIRAQSSVKYIENSTTGARSSLPGFATIDLRGEWHATKELKTGLKVVNLLDKEYSTRNGYVEEPRGVFATLTWTPEI